MARKLLLPVTLVALFAAAALSPVAQAAPPAFDIRGEWNLTSHTGGGNYHGVITWKTENCSTGAIAGSGAGAPYTWPESGTLDGAKISTQDGPYNETVYTSYMQGTVTDADHMSGVFSDSFGRIQENSTWEAVRSSGPPADGAGCVTAPPTPTPGLRASALQVRCNYLIATSTDTCTATVADAGPQPNGATPTGTVAFAAKQGIFSAGNSCTLTQTASSPGIASCSVQYIPPTVGGGFPAIAATYAGDLAHATATGSTVFLVLGGPVTYETPKPFTVKVTDNVPVDGTEVTACGLVASTGKAKAKSSQAKDVAADLRHINDAMATATPAQQERLIADQRAAQAAAAETLRQLRAADVADRKRIEELLKLLPPNFGVNAETCNVRKATGKVGELLSAGISAAKKRPRSASVGIVKLKSAPAGPLNLQLKLNRKVLRKIAGKHKRMTLWIRVNMVLPSGLSKQGWPMASVRHVTITRDGKLVR